MTISVTHSTVATLPDEAGAEINKDEWNAPHTVTGAVPDTRTVNGHALNSNVTVTASDVGAPSGSGTSSGTNTGDQTISDATISTSDITTNDVSTSKHGFTPKAPNDATKFLDGTGAWDTVKDSDLSTSDITTNDVSTSKHGFAPKLPNDATKFLNGTGAYSVPSGSGSAPVLDGQSFQTFIVNISNVAGTLKHAIWNDTINANTVGNYASKITGASATLNTTPTVDSSHDFTAGVGINSNNIVLDTAAQDASLLAGWADVEFYSGNVNLQKARVGFVSRNVNGTTRVRLEIRMSIFQSGSAWTINTTNIPSGTEIDIRVTVFLA